MPDKKHNGANIKVTDFTKEVIKRAAKSLKVSEIKLVADVIEQEFPRIAAAIEKESK